MRGDDWMNVFYLASMFVGLLLLGWIVVHLLLHVV